MRGCKFGSEPQNLVKRRIDVISATVIPGRATARTRNLEVGLRPFSHIEIPGSALTGCPGMTVRMIELLVLDRRGDLFGRRRRQHGLGALFLRLLIGARGLG